MNATTSVVVTIITFTGAAYGLWVARSLDSGQPAAVAAVPLSVLSGLAWYSPNTLDARELVVIALVVALIGIGYAISAAGRSAGIARVLMYLSLAVALAGNGMASVITWLVENVGGWLSGTDTVPRWLWLSLLVAAIIIAFARLYKRPQADRRAPRPD